MSQPLPFPPSSAARIRQNITWLQEQPHRPLGTKPLPDPQEQEPDISQRAAGSPPNPKQQPHATARPESTLPETPPQPDPLSREEREAAEAKKVADQTAFLKSTTMPICLRSMIFSLTGEPLYLDSCRAYRDETLLEAGNPQDPVEIVMLEQIMILTHLWPRLFSKALSQPSEEAKSLMMNSALKVLGHFRQHLTALTAYRESRGDKAPTARIPNRKLEKNTTAPDSTLKSTSTEPPDTRLDGKDPKVVPKEAS